MILFRAVWGVPALLVILLGLSSFSIAQVQPGGQNQSEGIAIAPESLENLPGDDSDASNESQSSAESEGASTGPGVVWPLVVLGIGILTVLGLIIGLKLNAFLALVIAAMVVSILAPASDVSVMISRVATAFGSTAGKIAIVIALAAIIGKCMLDSGSADRIVRAFLRLFGEKRSPVALMGSGFILAIPVFFDTVFYLLVPLARSLHRKTGKNYLLYILAIGGGGAITHTLVPPTPGPLLMAANLQIDVGTMILIGALVALPAALASLIFSWVADRIMKTPMRQIGAEPDPDPLADEELPSLFVALLPVLLPVILISASTVATTMADAEHLARLSPTDISDWGKFRASVVADANAESPTPGTLVWNNRSFNDRKVEDESNELSPAQLLLLQSDQLTEEQQLQVIEAMNRLLLDKQFYNEDAYLGVKISGTAKSKIGSNLERMKPVDVERMNRALLESAYPELIVPHQWESTKRKVANWMSLFGNANLALLLSTLIAMATLVRQRGLSLKELGISVEHALMSGGVIILITSGGGAFGEMLSVAQVGPAIEQLFEGSESSFSGGFAYLILGFLVAAVLKIAQGSSTVAMIVGSAMLAAIVRDQTLEFHPVYLATSIGAGSLFGSWMNDSGFWIFAKMGGITEVEALKSWTLMLIVLSLVSFGTSLLLAKVLPMVETVATAAT